MKSKKIFSGIVAGALAVSGLASLSMTSSAAEETKVLWEGSLWMNDKGADEAKNKGMNTVSLSVLDGNGDTAGSNGIQAPVYWKSGSKLVIDFDAQATYKGTIKKGKSLDLGVQIVGKLTDAWTWTQMDCFIKVDPSGNTYVVNDNDVIVDPDDEEFDQDWIDQTLIPGITATVDLDDEGETGTGQVIVDLDADADALSCGVNWYELITTMKEFDLKAADMTVNKISITGDYDAPVFDQWNDNGDGSYTWTSSQGKVTYDDSPEYLDGMNFDLSNVLTIPEGADVASISMDVEHSDWASVSLGVAQASDGEFAKTALGLDGTPSTESLVLAPEGGVLAGATPVFQCSFMNANCVLTISNFKVTLADGTEIVPTEDESSVVDESSEANSSSEVESSEAESSNTDSSSKSSSSSRPEFDLHFRFGKVKYQLKPDGDTIRFVYTIDESEAMSKKVEFFYIYSNLDENNYHEGEVSDRVLVTTAYRAFYAGGKKVTAPEGKVYMISDGITGAKDNYVSEENPAGIVYRGCFHLEGEVDRDSTMYCSWD